MNAWWSRQVFLNWCLRQTCVFASHATKTQICLQCCLVLRFFCDKVCETRDIEFAISIFTPARFVLSKLVNHCCCWSSQAKPNQNNSNHVKSSWIKPPNDTVEDSTSHLLKLQSVQFQAVEVWTTVVGIFSIPSSKSSDWTHPFVFKRFYPLQPR